LDVNTRFSVGVHILTLLVVQGGVPTSSDFIAASVNTNPALIRRLLTQLSKAGLTKSQMGSGGGALLARAPESITLRDVYEAMNEDGELVAMHQGPNPSCPVGRNIEALLVGRIHNAEAALKAQLAQTTIADLADGVEQIEARRRA